MFCYLGMVDGIISNDSDTFLFGGQILIKNMFKISSNLSNEEINSRNEMKLFSSTNILRELGLFWIDSLIDSIFFIGLNRNCLIAFALMTGSKREK